uniref:NB-ARC domain-containing protein n=1 Tax=Cannabis sativa TaxID=3483 RepID=A0A803P6P2_CANSA
MDKESLLTVVSSSSSSLMGVIHGHYSILDSVDNELSRLQEEVEFVETLLKENAVLELVGIGNYDDFKTLLSRLEDPLPKRYSLSSHLHHCINHNKLPMCLKYVENSNMLLKKYMSWVISVVGVRGIGKTTLVQTVYNDDKIKQHFELCLWAFIGADYQLHMTKIVKQLLQGAAVVPNLEMGRLHKELETALKGKKCFVVMDDMVDDNPLHWIDLKNLLMGCAKGTCVLITTRSKQVAETTRTGSVQSYTLGRLTEKASWCLFKRQAFVNIRKHDEFKKFQKKGRAIAAKCEGLPLSLIAMSIIVSNEPKYSSWCEFYDDKLDRKLWNYKDGFSRSKALDTRVAANVECRQTHSFVPQDMVVGRDEEKQEIIAELLKENHEKEEEKVMVIPIVGSGGLGKTTLAQLIFNDQEVESHFDLKIWLGFEQMILVLRQEIQEKRYLLILDDVWNDDEDKWKELLSLLSDAADGSRIVVTTRSRKVAEITGLRHLYELKMLAEDHSWLLFLKVAFVQGGEHPTKPEIVEIGKEIVRKCGGVPLVIRTIGSILFSQNPEKEWKSFYDKELLMILEKESDVLATLRLSYDHLPSPLKDCFAYCAIFPKDYEFDVDTLISLWMSQGFIGQDWEYHILGKELDKLGYDYFMDLLGRSFFQETKKDEFGKITKCKMQNSMHDLARIVAEKNVYASLGLKEEEDFDGSLLLRHVSFDFHLDSSWQIPISLAKSKHIRSLILPRQFRWAIEGRSSESICDVILKFKWLRMLDLHNSGIKVLPKSIGELVCLGYLDLSQNVNIKSLPSSISRLKNLQTLKLNHCSDLQTLPQGITMLHKLRILENESCYCLTHMPLGLHRLHKLRRLSKFVLSKSTNSSSISKKSGKLDELCFLDDLRGKLKIKNLSSPTCDKTEKANLEKKEDLVSLILIWDVNAVVDEANCEKALEDLKPHSNLRELSISSYGGSKFSSWLPLLINLVKLSISRCNKCQCLPQLDLLPKLEVLVVEESMKLEYILEKTSKQSFQSLKELRLTNLPALSRWWKRASKKVKEHSKFPCLSKLVVEDCPFLTSMPMFPCLKELLVLKNTSWEPLKKTMLAKVKKPIRTTSEFEASSSSTTSSTVAPLSELRTLQVINMSNGDPNMWQSLPSLHSVMLDHLVDINSEFEGLRKLTSLQQLHIRRCESLEEIPSWISDSKSLKTISIKLCPKLTIPRERINLITSLKKMEIEDCPQVSHIENMLKSPYYSK